MEVFNVESFIHHETSKGAQLDEIYRSLNKWGYSSAGFIKQDIIDYGVTVDDEWFIEIDDNDGSCSLLIELHNQGESGVIELPSRTSAEIYINAFFSQIVFAYGANMEDLGIQTISDGYEISYPERISLHINTAM